MKRASVLFLSLLSIALFQGCSQKTMTNTLFDINSEKDTDGFVWNIKQTRITTVNPLSSFEEVGQVCFLHPTRGAETAIYLDVNNSKDAYKIVKDYNSTAGQNELMNIRNDLLLLDKLTLKLLEKNHELTTYESLIRSDNNGTNKSTIILNDLNLTKSLRGEVKGTSNDLNTTFEKFLKDLNQSNAIIFKWSKENSSDNGGVLGEVASVKSDRNKKLHGFVLASGIRTERLILNKTFLKDITNQVNDTYTKRTGIITYLATAKHLLFVNQQDVQNIFGADLNISYDTFTGNSMQILQRLDKLKLRISQATIENGLSGGYLQNPIITKEPLTLYSKDCNASCSIDTNSSAFFEVYTELDDLDKLFKKE